MVVPTLPKGFQEPLRLLTHSRRITRSAPTCIRGRRACRPDALIPQPDDVLRNQGLHAVIEHPPLFVQHEVVREAVVFFEGEVGGIVRVNFGDGTAERGPGVGQRGVWSVL